LKELRANAKSFTGPRAPMSSVYGKEEEPPGQPGVFKISGSFKPAKREADDRFDPIVPPKVPLLFLVRFCHPLAPSLSCGSC